MKKEILAIFLSLFLVSIMFSVAAFASNCKVESVSGSKVILDCGSDAKNLEPGSSVQVKSSKKKKRIEGC